MREFFLTTDTAKSKKFLGKFGKLTLSIFAAALLVSCGGSSDSDSDDASGTNGGDDQPSSVAIDVAMTDNLFEPTAVKAKVGQEIVFTAINQGAAVHNMIIEGTDFKSEAMVNPGTSSTFNAVFTAPGVYRYVCAFHMPGMTGEITVEE